MEICHPEINQNQVCVGICVATKLLSLREKQKRPAMVLR